MLGDILSHDTAPGAARAENADAYPGLVGLRHKWLVAVVIS
jgi:hypothetical protein